MPDSFEQARRFNHAATVRKDARHNRSPIRRSRALITYGRSSKPLPLAGNHFLRQDVFGLSSNSEDETVVSKPNEPDVSSDESLLSDVESISKESEIRIPLERPPQHITTSSGLRDPVINKGEAKQSYRDRSRIARVSCKVSDRVGSHDRSKQKVSRKRSNDGMHEAQGVVPKPKIPSRGRRRPGKTAVGELVLIECPLQSIHDLELDSTPLSITTQDPILDEANMFDSSDTPLTNASKQGNKSTMRYRRRFATIPLHKAKLRARKKPAYIACASDERVQRGADGFEYPEMELGHKVRPTKRLRYARNMYRIRFAALKLGSGPLPDTVFDTDDGRLSLSYEADSTVDTYREEQPARVEVAQVEARPTQNHDLAAKCTVRDELVMAQLSSISAPMLQFYDDEDEDEDEEGEAGDVEDEEVDGEEMKMCGMEEEHDDEESDRNADDEMEEVEEDDENQIDDLGADMEVEELMEWESLHSTELFEEELGVHGASARLDYSISTRSKATDEPTEQDSDDEQKSPSTSPSPFNRQNIKGVAFNFQEPEPLGWRHSRPLHCHRLIDNNDVSFDILPNAERKDRVTHEIRDVTLPFHSAQRPRHRSILKNTTPALPSATSGQDNTTANTRLNSNKADVTDSGYFTRTLDTPDQIAPAQRVPLARRESSLMLEEDLVLVSHSEDTIYETSPIPSRYFRVN